LVDAFAPQLALYREGKWHDASSAFQIALKIKHDDFASTMYIQRYKKMKQHPAARPRDGVLVMTKK
jgi:uncharacterized protein HemY